VNSRLNRGQYDAEVSFESVTEVLARRWLCETRPEKLKPEAQWTNSGDRVGFLGRGSKPPPYQLRGLGECYMLTQWDPQGEATGKCGFGAFWRLKNQIISTFHSWFAVFSY